MKTLFIHSFKTFALGLILASSVHSVSATTAAAHTYVSGVGNDANPCSRTAPCATFQQAVNNTSAGGVVSVMDLGDYGPVTITHAVTIDGTGVQASIVVPSSNAPAITISGGSGDTIILRHLTLTGLPSSDSGVVLGGGNLVMDDCKISGFVNEYGLYLETSGSTIVQNTTITGCNRGAANFGSGLVSLRNVTLQGNQVGLNVQGGPTDISHSQITQNSSAGLYASDATLSVSDCMISGNGTAVYASGGSTIRLISNDLLNNATGITTAAGFALSGNAPPPPGIVSSTGDNRKAGNGTSGSVTPGKVITQQ